MNAVEGYAEVWLDSCCGHPQQTGVYHYHKYPTCVRSPFVDHPGEHSSLIGFAWDGFPIYGPYEGDGKMAADQVGSMRLDECNGHTDRIRGYHYHVTPGKFPYIIGGYRGEVVASNNRALNRRETGAIRDNTQGESDRIGQVITQVRPETLKAGSAHEITITIDPSAAIQGHDGPAPPPPPRGRPPRGRGPDRPPPPRPPGGGRPMPVSVPPEAPETVQVGPYIAEKIRRQGNTITVSLEIPADANQVTHDLHLQFGGEGRVASFKKSDAIRVVR